jgi:hypothetical protein
LDIQLAAIASGGISSLSLLDDTFRFRPLAEIFSEVSPGDWPLSQLALSTRSRNALLRIGVSSLSQLGALTPSEISDLRNTGEKTIQEVLDAYISKLDEGYAQPEGVYARNYLSPPSDSWSADQHVYSLLKILIDDINRRDIAVIQNSLSNEQVRVSAIGESWGVSRQRVYQIVDGLHDRLDQNPSTVVLSNLISSEYLVQTKSEVLYAFPMLTLGKIDGASSLTILDLLIYSGNIIRYKGHIVATKDFANLSEDAFISRVKALIEAEPHKVSPEVTNLLMQPDQSFAQMASNEVSFEVSLSRAISWLDNQQSS